MPETITCRCGNELRNADTYQSQLRRFKYVACEFCWSRSKRTRSFIGARTRKISFWKAEAV